MRKKKITYMAKEIGLGTSLFLITIKELVKLFFVLSLINIPTLLFIFEYNDFACGLNNKRVYSCKDPSKCTIVSPDNDIEEKVWVGVRYKPRPKSPEVRPVISGS